LLEPILARISEMNERSTSPPVAEYGGLPRRKTFFTIFDFARHQFFLLKGKEGFYARLRAQSRGAAITMWTRQSKTIFAGGKEFALPRLFFRRAGIWYPPRRKGAGGMRGGFFFGFSAAGFGFRKNISINH